MKRMIFCVTLLTVVATTGGCRRAATVVKEDSRESASSLARATRIDSLHRVFEMSLDSPRIVVEYIDSPRRVVTASARRVSTRESVAAGTNEKSETAVEAISDVRIQTREDSAPRQRLWVVAVLAVVAAYLAGRFRRHTS